MNIVFTGVEFYGINNREDKELYEGLVGVVGELKVVFSTTEPGYSEIKLYNTGEAMGLGSPTMMNAKSPYLLRVQPAGSHGLVELSMIEAKL